VNELNLLRWSQPNPFISRNKLQKSFIILSIILCFFYAGHIFFQKFHSKKHHPHFKKIIQKEKNNRFDHKSNFSVDQIRLAGFLQYPNQWIAIVMFPNKKSEEVKVGDVIGIENAKVMGIDQNGIWVKVNGTSKQIKNK